MCRFRNICLLKSCVTNDFQVAWPTATSHVFAKDHGRELMAVRAPIPPTCLEGVRLLRLTREMRFAFFHVQHRLWRMSHANSAGKKSSLRPSAHDGNPRRGCGFRKATIVTDLNREYSSEARHKCIVFWSQDMGQRRKAGPRDRLFSPRCGSSAFGLSLREVACKTFSQFPPK